uniref:STAS domain-containing protein n=1 Tax=uncultured bacterium esnapd14 TaxID=1366594 RepID=S5UBF9_9BACT|nr:hypothetical protein [uncultured bacterium esnapd14]
MYVTRQHGNRDGLAGLVPGDHVCVAVGSPEQFEAQIAVCLAEGAARGEKLFRFTPDPATTSDCGQQVTIVNPAEAFLAGGPLVPATMFDMFAAQTSQAHAEGYRGIRLVADMDWLLGHPPTPPQIAAFEQLLDRVVSDLSATVVCAYRPGSFTAATVAEVAAVHPLYAGPPQTQPLFRLFNTGGSMWELTGEIDMSNLEDFQRAVRTAAAAGPVSRLHCGGLEFISAAGLAIMARLAGEPAPHPMLITQAPGIVKHCWDLLGLSERLDVTFSDVRPSGVLAEAESSDEEGGR